MSRHRDALVWEARARMQKSELDNRNSETGKTLALIQEHAQQEAIRISSDLCLGPDGEIVRQINISQIQRAIGVRIFLLKPVIEELQRNRIDVLYS